MGYVKEVGLDGAVYSDMIVLGAPNHMGRPSRTMKAFVERLAASDLKAQRVAVFGTYAGRERQQDRAVKKLERLLAEKLPRLKLVVPGLSVRVTGIWGPVIEGELPKCVEFGRRIASQLMA